MSQLKYLVFLSLFILQSVSIINAQDFWIPYRSLPFRPPEPELEMPIFPNGTDAMLQFISDNLTYPKEVLKKEIGGRVVLRFIVTSKGNIKDIIVIRSVHHLLDKEAIRIVSIMPRWTPGTKGGKPADIEFTLPILFRLPNGKEETSDMIITISE